MGFLERNREAIGAGIISGLIVALALAALKFLWGTTGGIGTLLVAIGPSVVILVTATLVGIAVGSAVVAIKGPPRLRWAVLRCSQMMRRYAEIVDGSPGNFALPEDFWKSFPFKLYDDLQERMILAIGRDGTIPMSAFLPNSTSVIRNIANELEREALKLPSDMLL